MDDRDKQSRISYATSLGFTELPGLQFSVNEEGYIVDLDVADALRIFIDNPSKSSDEQRSMIGDRLYVWFGHAIYLWCQRIGDPGRKDLSFVQQDHFYEEVQQAVRDKFPDMATIPKYSGHKIKRIFNSFCEARVASMNDDLRRHGPSAILDPKKQYDFPESIATWNCVKYHTVQDLHKILEFAKNNFEGEAGQKRILELMRPEPKSSMFTSPWEPSYPPLTSFSASHPTHPHDDHGTLESSHNTQQSSLMTGLTTEGKKLRDLHPVEHEAQINLEYKLKDLELQHATEIGRLQSQHASQLADSARLFNDTVERLTSSFESQNLRQEAEIKNLTSALQAQKRVYQNQD